MTNDVPVRYCELCGAEIPTGSMRRKYCSDRCGERAKYEKAKLRWEKGLRTQDVCCQCGMEYTPKAAGQRFCGHACLNNYIRDVHAKRREKLDMIKILITKELPLFNELKPVVGAVYEAERYKQRYNTFYIIPDIGGKRIVVRDDECVEVGERRKDNATD